MNRLLDREPARAGPAGRPPPSTAVAAVQAALRATAGGLVPVAAPVVVAWVLGAGGQATWSQAVRLALGLWLLAQHTGLVVSGGHVGLVPLGLALVPFASTWFAGRWLARTMDPRGDRIAAGATRAAPAMLPWRCLLGFTGAYCLLATLVSVAAGMPGLRPISAQAALGAAVVAFLGGGAGAAVYRFRGPRAAVREALRRVPDVARPWIRPALAAQTVHVAGGAAVVAALVAGHVEGVTQLHRALAPGVVGGAVLTLGEVMLVPNLVVWASAALAGPGFAIGAGTSVTVTSSQLGPLPAVPVLAALPPPGSLPPTAAALLAVPVLGGVVGGVVVCRAGAGTLRARLGTATGAGLLCGITSSVLAWLSGGPAGPGRLAVTGPDPLLTGAAAAAEVTVGAVLTVLAVAGVPPLLRRMERLEDLADDRTPSGSRPDGGA
ncbi:MAG TPA: DUF6350 family protein, partial [Kineosporiaceae bacterium]